jgi:4-hydroxy-3-methylbut-2-enyl diphosphate reductase
MKIKLAKTAGYCMGVRRAVDMALDLQRSEPRGPVATYGPLIHNPQTLEFLETRGVKVKNSLDEIEGGTVVIRAHGISPQERSVLESKGADVIDATCPRVAAVQAVIAKHSISGRFCFIIGDNDHPEVKGLLGFAAAGGAAIASVDEKEIIEALPSDREVCVVAQTTQDVETFLDVVEAIRDRFPTAQVYNTICGSTKSRQAEVCKLARQVDKLVVVGGRGSGNTRRLVKVAQGEGVDAIHVETADEIPVAALAGARVVGVTAGASTPNWQIQRVIYRLKQIGRSRAARPLRALRRIFDVAVMTYLWAALGGGGLTAACMTLRGQELTWLPLATAFFFVFSMHLLNRVLEGSGAVRFNAPEIAAFYGQHRSLLLGLGGVSCALALVLGWLQGLTAFIPLAATAAGGLIYTVQLRLPGWSPIKKRRSLKDIPGSKTPLVALGWAMACAVLPAGSLLETRGAEALPGFAVSFLFAAGMVFWRTALSDLLDIQGDRMVGRETIPILIGVRKAGRLLLGLLASMSAIVVVGAALGWTTSLGYWLLVNTATFGAVYLVYEKRRLVDRLSFDAMVEGNLLLSGLLSTIYCLV